MVLLTYKKHGYVVDELGRQLWTGTSVDHNVTMYWSKLSWINIISSGFFLRYINCLALFRFRCGSAVFPVCIVWCEHSTVFLVRGVYLTLQMVHTNSNTRWLFLVKTNLGFSKTVQLKNTRTQMAGILRETYTIRINRSCTSFWCRKSQPRPCRE